MISAAAGTMPACSIVWIVAQPSSRERNITCSVPRRFGMGMSLSSRPGDDAEGPLGAGEEALEVVAGDVLDRLAAGLEDRPVGQDHLEAHHVVGRHAVLDGPHAAGVLRHVAADGGELPARRVGRIEEPLGGAVVVEIDRPHPRLGRDHHVSLVQLDDPRHAVEAERDPAVQGDAAAGAAARRAPRRDGNRLFVRDGHHLRHLFRRQRPDDEVGLVRRQQRHEGGVIGIAETVEVGIENVFRPDNRTDLLFDLFGNHPDLLVFFPPSPEGVRPAPSRAPAFFGRSIGEASDDVNRTCPNAG